MMQPLDQQSKELFDDETQPSDLVGSLAPSTFWDITRAMIIGGQSPICLWNIQLKSGCTVLLAQEVYMLD